MTRPDQQLHDGPPPPPMPPEVEASLPRPTSGGTSLELSREAASMALANRPGADLANLTEEEFERGLERLKLRQTRMHRILDEVLVPNAHYGNPNNAWNKPRLLKPGAEEIANLLRLSPRYSAEVEKDVSAEWVSITVRIALYDWRGIFITEKTGNCNSLEKRFARKGGQGFIYKDAREVLHDCHAVADKRAFVAAVVAASGCDAFFSAEETMDKALSADQEGREDVAMSADNRRPATEDELRVLYDLARDVGIRKREEFSAFVEATLGRRFIGAADVVPLTTALEARPKVSA